MGRIKAVNNGALRGSGQMSGSCDLTIRRGVNQNTAQLRSYLVHRSGFVCHPLNWRRRNSLAAHSAVLSDVPAVYNGADLGDSRRALTAPIHDLGLTRDSAYSSVQQMRTIAQEIGNSSASAILITSVCVSMSAIFSPAGGLLRPHCPSCSHPKIKSTGHCRQFDQAMDFFCCR